MDIKILRSLRHGLYEALYVDGELVHQAEGIGEGQPKINYIKEVLSWEADLDSITLNDIHEYNLTSEGEDYIGEYGEFPEDIDDIKYKRERGGL